MVSLDDQVRALVDERLRELGIVPGEDVTYDAQHLPPGFKSPEAFAAACRKLGLASVLGCKAGRGWRVPAHVWNEVRAVARFRRATEKLPINDEEQADRLLRGNPRLRLVGGK
jgi:hypothetical protein